MIKLSKVIPWDELAALVKPDFENSTHSKLCFKGRKLDLRMHLGIFCLKCLYNEPDRVLISRIKDTPVLQVFVRMHFLDSPREEVVCFQKVEEFRNRLSFKTASEMNDLILKCDRTKCFIQNLTMDDESTLQEVNMTYPTDMKNMYVLARKMEDMKKLFS